MIFSAMSLCQRLARVLCAGNKRVSYWSRKYLSIINFKEYTGEKGTFIGFYLVLGGIICNSGFIIFAGRYVCITLHMHIYMSVCLHTYLNGLFIERDGPYFI